MSQHPILMYGEPPGAGREGREEKEGGREAGGGADGASERRAGASAVQVNYYPQHGENTSDDDDDDRDRHGGKDICAARPPAPAPAIYLLKQDEANPELSQKELISEQFLTNSIFVNAKSASSFLGITPRRITKG